MGMGMVRSPMRRPGLRLAVAATAAFGCVASMAAGVGADAAPASAKLAKNVSTSKLPGSAKPNDGRPQGLPRKGTFAFLLELNAKSTSSVYATTKRNKGTASARSAARSQLTSVRAAQNRVIADLPSKTSVLYRTHAAAATVAVVSNVKNYAALRAISGVSAVHPIAPKSLSNSYAVPYQGGAAAWEAYGDLGQNS